MNKVKYEGAIDGYFFIMKEDDVIEVWSDFDSEYPHSFIYVKAGSIKNEKSFHYEIMDWCLKNK